MAGWELTVGLFLTPGVISSQSQKEGVRVGHTCPSFAAQSLRGLAEVQAFRPGRGQCGEGHQGPPRTPMEGACCPGCLSKAVWGPSVHPAEQGFPSDTPSALCARE